MLASLKIKNTKLYTKKSKNKSYFTNSFRFSSGGSNWKPRVQQITELMGCNLIDLPNFMKTHSMFRFRPCYSYFFVSLYLFSFLSVFTSREKYRFTRFPVARARAIFFVLESTLNFLPSYRSALFLRLSFKYWNQSLPGSSFSAFVKTCVTCACKQSTSL